MRLSNYVCSHSSSSVYFDEAQRTSEGETFAILIDHLSSMIHLLNVLIFAYTKYTVLPAIDGPFIVLSCVHQLTQLACHGPHGLIILDGLHPGPPPPPL